MARPEEFEAAFRAVVGRNWTDEQARGLLVHIAPFCGPRLMEEDGSKPKLMVRACEASFVGGRGFLLCDGDGEPLPHQTAFDIHQPSSPGGMITITAEFAIDGTDVVLA